MQPQAASTSSMSSPASISVDDNFSSSQTSISFRSTDNKLTGGVDEVHSVLINEFLGNNRVNNMFDYTGTNFFIGDIGIMLSGNKDVLNSERADVGSFFFVFDSDLSFSIRTHPCQSFIFSHFICRLIKLK